MLTRCHCRWLILFVAVSLLPAEVFSQSSGQQREQSEPVLEEIVVTARKFEESLQDVPIAVTVLDGKELAESNIFDLSQIAGRVPSLTWQSHNTQHSEISLRGIGTIRNFGPAGDASVGTFLDEIYISRRGVSTPPLFDLERVEVLRGPQGTLFGKNVVGGALSIITAKPQFERDASFSVGAGNYSAIQSSGHVTGPASDTVALRFAFYQEKHDGYAENIVFGEELEDLEAYAARASLAWLLSDTVRFDLTIDASTQDGNGQSRHAVDDPLVAGPGTVTPNLRSQDPRTNESPYDQWAEKDTRGITARTEWDIGSGTATYLAAWRTGEGTIRWTQTGSTSPPTLTDSTLTQPEDNSSLTQELRYASNRDSRFNWLVGFYYLNDKTDYQARNKATSFLPGGAGSLRDILDGDYNTIVDFESRDYAIFADTNYRITDELTLSLGGRYTRNEKDWEIEAVVLGLGPPPSILPTAPVQGPYQVTDSDAWSEFTPKVSLDWQFADDMLAYASAAKGFKGGGWQSGAGNAIAASIPYNPETAWTYELGLKTELFGGRMRFNAAAFYTDFQDLQVELLDDVNLVLVIANAADAVVKGLEVEMDAALTESLTLFASGSYIDSEYKDYIDPLRGFDYSGNTIQRTPETQYRVGFDFNRPVSRNIVLIGNAQYSYQSKFYFGPDSTNFEPSYGLLDMRLGFGQADGNWSVLAWARNLTDELYRVSIIPFVGDEFSSFGAPRTYGLTFSMNF